MILLAVSALFAAAPLPLDAAPLCAGVYRPSIPYGELRTDFVHSSGYKVTLPEKIDIKNQCNLGTCHLYSWTAMLERDYVHENRKSLKLSAEYLSARHWLQKSFDALESKKADVDIKLGSTSLSSRKAILAYGLIPESAWPVTREFNLAPLSGRIKEYVQNIVAEARWQKDREIDLERRKEIIAIAKKRITDVFENLLGPFPKDFVFEGRRYTPHSFASEKFPQLTEPVVVMRVNEDAADPTRNHKYKGSTSVTTSIEHVERTARELLDLGEPVYLSYHHNHSFVDRKTGIMSIEAFHVPSGAGPLSREQRAHFSLDDGGHAVQLVGYDVNPQTGHVSKWKIQNSWGEKAGEQGVFHMYADYFTAFATGLTFYREADVKLPKNQVQDPVQLGLPF